MKIIGVTAAAACLALSGAQAAAAKPVDGAEQLRKGLAALAHQANQPPSQSARPDDPDMGDDNASDRAFFVVCVRNADTPAAERSAICDRSPVSPD